MKKDQLHILEKIERAEVSPFLLTRIRAKVQEQLNERLSARQTVVYLAGIAAVVVLNLLVLRNGNTPDKQDDLVSRLNLTPSNQLYR